MLPLETQCHSHYHLYPLYFMLFKIWLLSNIKQWLMQCCMITIVAWLLPCSMSCTWQVICASVCLSVDLSVCPVFNIYLSRLYKYVTRVTPYNWKLRGRKNFHKFWRFVAIHESFLHKIWKRGIFWHRNSKQSAQFILAKVFFFSHQFTKVFSCKVPAIWYLHIWNCKLS